MIISPRIRGYICTTAHPTGCATQVSEQLEYVRSQATIAGVRRALVIGCSAGYGLASRVVAATACQAATLGVSLEKEPSDTRPASAGWYANRAFDELARQRGLWARSVHGDAFAQATKQIVVDTLKQDLGPIDLLVYSLAAPVRTHPVSGERFRSVIKPLGKPYSAPNLALNVIERSASLKDVSLEPASAEETAATVAVMGGEDWGMWIDLLEAEGLLSDSCKTVAFTYLGSELTHPIYRGGTLGKAKEDLDDVCQRLNARFDGSAREAYVAVLKAVVTQASTAIPVVPLYVSVLFKVMQERGTYETTIEHIYRLFTEQLYTDGSQRRDSEGRLRLDNLELDETIQREVAERWARLSDSNLNELADIDLFCSEFLKIFGFGFDAVDYAADVDHL